MTGTARVLYIIGIVFCCVILFVCIVTAVVSAAAADYVNAALSGFTSTVGRALYLFLSTVNSDSAAAGALLLSLILSGAYLAALILSVFSYFCLASRKTTCVPHVLAIVAGVFSASFLTSAAGIVAVIALMSRKAGKR